MAKIRVLYNPQGDYDDLITAVKEFSQEADIEIDCVPIPEFKGAKYQLDPDVAREVYDRVWHGIDNKLLEVYRRYK